MLLEKSENLLELSVKQLEIRSRLARWLSPGQDICLVCGKSNFNIFCGKVWYFRIQQELFKSKSNLIPFKKILNPNHYPKVLFKSFPANYSKKFV